MESAFEHTHFGERTVRLDEKQGLVDAVFHNVADRYDLMNDLMSFGLHRLWKDALRRQAAAAARSPVPPSRRRRRHRRHRLPRRRGWRRDDRGHGRRRQSPTCCASAPSGRTSGREGERVRFVEGNAEALPLPDASFDAYTIAFGIRNVPRIERALAEAYRVLKRGGRFLCLEFSRVDVPVFDRLYAAYSDTAIPALGKAVTGDGARLSLSRRIDPQVSRRPSASPT